MLFDDVRANSQLKVIKERRGLREIGTRDNVFMSCLYFCIFERLKRLF
jgi:hypothetical protein